MHWDILSPPFSQLNTFLSLVDSQPKAKTTLFQQHQEDISFDVNLNNKIEHEAPLQR
jgi:hypothetical protein